MSNAPLSVEDRHALSFWDLGTVLSASNPASGTVNRTVLLQPFQVRWEQAGLNKASQCEP